MTVLIKAVNGATTYYLKQGGAIAISSVSGSEQTYLPKIDTVDDLSYELSDVTGGQVKMNFGGFSLLPDFAAWPVPRFMDVTIYKQLKNQDGSISSEITLMDATVMATNINSQNIRYEIYDKIYDVDLLDDAPDLGSVTNRVYPLALGVVNLVVPLQVGAATDWEYHKAGIVETTPGTGVYKIYDNEVEKTVTIDDQTTKFQSILIEVWVNGTSIESGISDGDLVTIAGTGTPNNYAGFYIVTDTRTNGVKIRLNPGTGYKSYTSGNTLGGVSITSVDSIEGKPKGTVLMSGTGLDTTLIGFFDWAKDRINTALTTSYTLDSSKALSVSISGYETQQKNLIAFMSDLAAQTNHMFYINTVTDTIHLIDMQTNDGTLSVDEYGYFNATYNYQNPIKSIIYEWTDKTIDTDDQGYPILTNQVQSQKVLLDSDVGKEDVPCKVYHRVISNIETLLVACGKSLQAPICTITLPFQAGIVPGLKITTDNDSTLYGGSGGISTYVRSIGYDFENEQIICKGHVI